MAETPIMPLYTDALLADTAHLAPDEFGAYMRLLVAMWRSPEPRLPNDAARLSRIAGVGPKRWATMWPVLVEFFIVTGPQITQKRLLREKDKALRRIEAAKISGSIGGSSNALKNHNVGAANAKNPLKRNSSERGSETVADGQLSIIHNPEEDKKPLTTTNDSLHPKPEPAAQPEPGGGFFKDQESAEPDWSDEEPGLGDEPIPVKPPRPAWAILGEQLLDLADLADKPRPISTSIVRQWLADWPEADIRAAVSDAVERESYDPNAIGNLKYFEPAIRRRVEGRDAEQRSAAEKFWAGFPHGAAVTFIGQWRDGVFEWEADKHGPAPDQPGYMGPSNLSGPRDLAPGPAPRRQSNVTSFPEAAARQA